MRHALWPLVLVACIGNGDKPSRANLPRLPRLHRAESADCASERVSAEPVLSPSTNSVQCTQNADCSANAKRNGRCVVDGAETHCVYDACVTSADCPGIAVCECGSVANQCVDNGCKTDAGCGKGGACSPSPSSCASQSAIAASTDNDGVPHYCHTIDDQCIGDVDCKGKGICAYVPSTLTWRCTGAPCE